MALELLSQEISDTSVIALIGKVQPYYDQPHRRYHTLKHIEFMFKVAQQLGIELSNAQKIAIAFHDVIWVPGNDNANVRLSATLLRTLYAQEAKWWVTFGFTEGDAILGAKIIEDTSEHVATITDSKIVIDLDLCGFACYPPVFRTNNIDILFEFEMYGVEEWKAGRKSFMLQMIEREPFFLTEYFDKPEFNNQVWTNVCEELKMLR